MTCEPLDQTTQYLVGCSQWQHHRTGILAQYMRHRDTRIEHTMAWAHSFIIKGVNGIVFAVMGSMYV